MLFIEKLNEIINKTIDAIDKSKGEILDIADAARAEYKRIENELEVIKEMTLKVIKAVDQLQIQEKESRFKLMVVSKNIMEYKETDIRKAYETAKDLQVALATKRSEEQQLIEKRNENERRLKVAMETARKAESLVSRVGVVMDFLSGGLQNLSIQIEDIKQKQLLGIKIIKAQEEERKRVAREIHDGPAQIMANLVIKTELCEKLLDIDPSRVKEELQNLRKIARSSLGDVRKIIYDLRPMSLDDLGLIPTAQRFIANFMDETGIAITFQVLGEQTQLKSVVEIAAFRIMQESLNNIKKHAFAKSVDIKIEFCKEDIKMAIKDSGIGFNKEEVKPGDEESGYGLMSMKERVELLNGKFDLATAPGKGTRVFVAIPLQINEE